MTTDDGELIAIDLDGGERKLMVLVLNEYAGSAQHSFELLAPMVGHTNQKGWMSYVFPLMEAIDRKELLSDLDWARALFLTEIGFGSDLVGSGRHFGRGADEHWIVVLRSLQDKISTRHRYLMLRDNAIYPPVPRNSSPDIPGMGSLSASSKHIAGVLAGYAYKESATDGNDEVIAIDLENVERELMVQALNEYAGTAQQAFEMIAPLVGQSTEHAWWDYVVPLKEAVKKKEPLSDLAWARALFLTEVGFTSDLVGSGRRFGRRADEYWIVELRSLQDKISTHHRYLLLRDNAIHPPVPRTSSLGPK